MMNGRLQQFARDEILKDLEHCTGGQRRFFVIMHMGREQDSLPRDVKEDISMDELKAVVEQIAPESLSWAMEQTRKTVLKNRGEW